MRDPKFSLFGKEGCKDFFSFFLSLFSSCSPNVLSWGSKGFPKFSSFSLKTFLIAPHFYPICFAESLTLIYINWKCGWKGEHLFLIGNWLSKQVHLLESVQCSKNFGDGPINMAPSQKKRKERVSTPPMKLIINMNHSKVHQLKLLHPVILQLVVGCNLVEIPVN